MTFKLNEKDSVELQYSFRINIYFEQIAGHSLDFQNITANDLVTLLYSAVIASLQKQGRPIITMLDMLNMIDDYNGGEVCIMNFSNWYVEIMQKQFEIINSMMQEKPEDKKVKTSKKKTT